MIVVFSRPGRELVTAATMAALETHGGGHLLPAGTKHLFWVGETLPPDLPPGWGLLHIVRPPRGSVPDFWALLDGFPGVDLCVFEDDVYPCRNALPYVDSWPFPGLTSFFNPQGRPVGARKITVAQGFVYSQAIKIPRALAAQLVAAGPSTTRRDHDVAIGDVCRLAGVQVYYHRSLVEHVEPRSVGRVSGPRPLVAADYVGRDFDALQGQASTQ